MKGVWRARAGPSNARKDNCFYLAPQHDHFNRPFRIAESERPAGARDDRLV
jgi:hypothetical protein